MKKIIIGVCMATTLVLGTTSCGCGQKCDVNNDSIVSTELSDSVNTYYGIIVGMQINKGIEDQYYHGVDVDVKEYLKGLQMATSQPHSDSYMMGLSMGIKIAGYLDYLKAAGVEIDRDVILAKIREYATKDKVDLQDINEVDVIYQGLTERVGKIEYNRAKMRAEQAAECAQNTDCKTK